MLDRRARLAGEATLRAGWNVEACEACEVYAAGPNVHEGSIRPRSLTCVNGITGEQDPGAAGIRSQGPKIPEQWKAGWCTGHSSRRAQTPRALARAHQTGQRPRPEPAARGCDTGAPGAVSLAGRSSYAQNMSGLGGRLAENGRSSEAQRLFTLAIDAVRALYVDAPESAGPKLAFHLNEYSWCLASSENTRRHCRSPRRPEALAACQTVLDISRELTKTDPEESQRRPALTETLRTRSRAAHRRASPNAEAPYGSVPDLVKLRRSELRGGSYRRPDKIRAWRDRL